MVIIALEQETPGVTMQGCQVYTKAELITFELIPLVPYPGFDRLFEVE
jgi:hypothetical protein